MRPSRKFDRKAMLSITDGTKLVQRVVDRPQTRLGDMSVRQLFEMFGDGSQVWLTGSSVWLPAVFGEMPPADGDFDIVFSEPQALRMFVKGAMGELNRRVPVGVKGYTLLENRLGGARIHHPDGRGVIDCWHLGENQSIAELMLDYPGESYIRCAYLLSHAPMSHLVRIIQEPKTVDVTELLRSSSKQSYNGYYGSIETAVPMKPGLLNDLLI